MNFSLFEDTIKEKLSEAIKELFQIDEAVKIEKTKADFEGDYTFVVFAYLRYSKLSPEQTAQKVGEWMMKNATKLVGDFNTVKGFLNLSVHNSVVQQFIAKTNDMAKYGASSIGNNKKVMVEYSSPNTNKPLHLGHIRNNLIGYSLAELLKYTGHDVMVVNLINDRGIHICKSMLAWQLYGNGETPESSGVKGDFLVGKYYVKFDQEYKKEIDALMADGMEEKLAKKESAILKRAEAMLIKWEANDKETIDLWQKMNQWVYDGFEVTYSRLGSTFDKYYYESNTYKLGKSLVQEGLDNGAFIQEEDQSVWIDLTNEKLDKKILQRGNGTSVYMTQDMGTAELKYNDFPYDLSIYVVGNEQEYHFKVLKLTLEKLGKNYAKGIYHLSYGMVELPDGKMKSREGKVVDADDLLDEMHQSAKTISEELGKTEGFSIEEKENLYEMIGQAAIKYFILKVDPKKTITFDPAASIDFQGDTGPFIQYTYARISSILRKEQPQEMNFDLDGLQLSERELALQLMRMPLDFAEAATNMDSSKVASWCFETAKLYNKMYNDLTILKETDNTKKQFRLKISSLTAQSLKKGFEILGIGVPERM